jgi:NADPH2 dehydrogenase
MINLFSEISLRNHKIKNRIVMPPMVCAGFTEEDGLLTIKNIERYRERARGGVGLIIVEATCVDPAGKLSKTQLGLWSDDQIRGFSRLAEYCHEHEAKVLVQIHHAGLAVAEGVTADPLAPSDFEGKSKVGRDIKARALTLDEIHQLQDKFVAAALRAQKAGLDGVELHGAHGYLISQFFSPLINKRQDEYGGSLINRARFAAELIARIRQATGPDFLITCRIGCDEPDIQGSIALAQELEKAGVDMLHISTGITNFLAGETLHPAVPPYFHYNWIVYGGTLVKEKVKVPVIVVNSIRTPLEATYLVEQGYADFVAVGRGLLVDHEWANKGQKYLPVVTCNQCKACAYRIQGNRCPQTKIRKNKGG